MKFMDKPTRFYIRFSVNKHLHESGADSAATVIEGQAFACFEDETEIPVAAITAKRYDVFDNHPLKVLDETHEGALICSAVFGKGTKHSKWLTGTFSELYDDTK